MSLPEIATREEWLVARKELRAREKELTRERDALNADRRRLPMVVITKTNERTVPAEEGCVARLARTSRMHDSRWELCRS